MRCLLRTVALASLLGACGQTPGTSSLLGSPEPRTHWEEIAPSCAGHPSKEHCDDGDMVLFGGLLCASGDERGCTLVRASQSADGQWWRSPRRNPGNLGRPNSFSRDMALGVFLYLATTRDTNAAERWLRWIETHRPCVTTNPIDGSCLAHGPHRFCTDDQDQRCAVSPANWGLLGRVFTALDLPRSLEMRLNALTDAESLRLKSHQAPPGYELHLAGVEVLLRQKLDVTRDLRDEVAARLAERQPDNPYFTYLKSGATELGRQRLVELCPRPDGGAARRFQWSWERDTDSRAWQESMGWDCLFLDNLLTI